MAKFKVRYLNQTDEVEATDWGIESGFVVFVRPATKAAVGTPKQHRVWAAKVEDVHHIELKEE